MYSHYLIDNKTIGKLQKFRICIDIDTIYTQLLSRKSIQNIP